MAASDSGDAEGLDSTADESLSGGRMSGVVMRRGDTVRRPAGEWTPTVHAVLRHLEAVGFDGAPRVIGVEGDTEIVTFMHGDVPADPDWEPGRGNRLPEYARTDDALVGAARLLAKAHVALEGFDPPLAGFQFHPHPRRAGEVVCHGDVGPWNTVYRDGVPTALIDWDACQPMDPIIELGFAAWGFVPLAPAERLAQSGFDADVDIARRLRRFVDAYGLHDRGAVIPALQKARLIGAERVRFWPIRPADAAAAIELVAADLRWLASVADELADALQ